MRYRFRKIRSVFILLILFFPGKILAQDTTQHIIPGRFNSPEQQQKPYVILISADGFRYDLADKYDAEFLKKISSEGVKAASMKPCYPSLTFPNLPKSLFDDHRFISFTSRNCRQHVL